jgi:HEAT repeat protein
MSQIRDWLKEGDLTSDGRANEVVQVVLSDLSLVEDLIEYLDDEDSVVRSHAADALEKVARTYPAQVGPYLAALFKKAREDPVAMVRWHVAMIFGHLSMFPAWAPELKEALIGLLSDPSPFSQSWAIVSLCLIARQYPQMAGEIVAAVAPLAASGSVAIRARVRRALPILTDARHPLPKGWIKCDHLAHLASS